MSELTHINCVALTARFPVGKPVVPAATLSGPGGEGQSAVARLTGEKKNHPGAQYANRLSPRVGRFINAAGENPV
ncbi:hypothetical protein ACT4UM_00550 [Bacillus sp. SS-TM]